jgi:hypothetical protein
MCAGIHRYDRVERMLWHGSPFEATPLEWLSNRMVKILYIIRNTNLNFER